MNGVPIGGFEVPAATMKRKLIISHPVTCTKQDYDPHSYVSFLEQAAQRGAARAGKCPQGLCRHPPTRGPGSLKIRGGHQGGLAQAGSVLDLDLGI